MRALLLRVSALIVDTFATVNPLFPSLTSTLVVRVGRATARMVRRRQNERSAAVAVNTVVGTLASIAEPMQRRRSTAMLKGTPRRSGAGLKLAVGRAFDVIGHASKEMAIKERVVALLLREASRREGENAGEEYKEK